MLRDNALNRFQNQIRYVGTEVNLQNCLGISNFLEADNQLT